MSGRTDHVVVVGDVHGEAGRLARFFEYFDARAERLVFVGDYINRGPSSKDVLEILCAHKRKIGDRLVLLRGNHEESLIEFVQGGPIEDFARHGGLATLRSYIGDPEARDLRPQLLRAIPEDHLELIRGTLRYFVDSAILVTHAGFDTEYPHDFTRKELIVGDPRIFTFKDEWPRPTVVIGHFIQRSGLPLIGQNLIALDTGCGSIPNAPLTAVSLPGRTVFQF